MNGLPFRFMFYHFQINSIMKIRENGIQSRERSRIYKMRPKCDSDGKNFGSVRLIDCYAAMLILVYGFVASFMMFCVETFFKSKLHQRCVTRIEMCKEACSKPL